MSDYRVSVRVSAPIQSTYDHCVKYFQSLGYMLVNAIPPSRMEFSKKGTMWTFDEIDATHKLTVFLNEEAKDVVMSFNFYCSLGVGEFSDRSRAMVNSEIHTLRGLIQGGGVVIEGLQEGDRVCVDCNKQIPWDANLCPYCGHDYRQTAKE